MLTMSVQHSGAGPPLPKRTASQRKACATANHAPPQTLRSKSTDSPPPLPPHHPEPKTLTRRGNKSESEAHGQSGSQDGPELPSRSQSLRANPIQRKAFETNSFIDRNTAKIFSDPSKYERRSLMVRRSPDGQPKRALPSLPPDAGEQHVKQNPRERPLPPPPDTGVLPSLDRSKNLSHNERPLPPPPNIDSLPSSERRTFLSNHATQNERSLPPPPSISTIPTGRRQSIPGQGSQREEPLPPPSPVQSIPAASGKMHHVALAFESDLPPPPPPARKTAGPVRVQQTHSDSPPPLPPSRIRSTPSFQNTQDVVDFEKKFVFHEEYEFPEPEEFSNRKKEYPSQVINKRKSKTAGSIGSL